MLIQRLFMFLIMFGFYVLSCPFPQNPWLSGVLRTHAAKLGNLQGHALLIRFVVVGKRKVNCD